MLRRLCDREIRAFRLPVAVLAGYSLLLLYNTFFNSMAGAWEASVASAFIRDGYVPDGSEAARFAFRWLFWPALIAAGAFRFAVIFSGPLRYQRVLGRSWSTEVMASIVLANGLGLIAVIAEHGDGSVLARVNGWIESEVPTLVVIEPPFALLAANVVGGFAYYWWHRLQHAWRPLWLLTHRIHHLPPQLTIVSTTPTEDPIGGLLSFVPRVLILGGAAKLFSTTPMIPEAFLWSVLSWTAFEVVNHDEPSYRWTLGGPIRRFWFAALGGGAWHLMHHSARPGHEAVNLGGFPFQIWDRMFGTYVAPEPDLPPIGLTGRPHLWRNPLRLAFGGWAQLVGELWQNPGVTTRLRILFGSATYLPSKPVYVLTRPGEPEEL